MEVASLVVACLAAVGSLIAVWYAQQSAKSACRVAQIEADRREDERDEMMRNRVVFNLVPDGDSSYLLVNRGSGPAYDVHVDLGDLGGLQGEVTDFDEFPDGEAAKFHLSATYGSKTTHVVVTWHCLEDKSDAVQSKRFSAP